MTRLGVNAEPFPRADVRGLPRSPLKENVGPMPTRGELLSIAIRFQLGELISDELPGMAATLLAERLDTPSLREVAGDLHPTMAEAGAVFSRALAELGVALTHEEAALLRAEEVAGSILRGECSPDSGASEIYYLQRHHGALYRPALVP